VKRRVFNVLAAVSLLLCVATAALWVRSHWVIDRFEYSPTVSAHAGSLSMFDDEPGRMHFAIILLDFPAE
jgi:hypothetical protein